MRDFLSPISNVIDIKITVLIGKGGLKVNILLILLQKFGKSGKINLRLQLNNFHETYT